jgi:hypothetical protein
MTVLIGFNGLPHSGKDTAGQVVREWGQARGLNVHVRAFAHSLKLAAARALGFASATNVNDAVVLMDELKETGLITVEVPSLSYMQGFTGREYLKWFGTEACRDVFGKDFWVDLLLPPGWIQLWHEYGENYPEVAVITDVRFVNEAQRILDFGGKVVEIHRPGLERDNHASELPLPRKLISHTIENDETIDVYKTRVNQWMTEQYHNQLYLMSQERDD